MSRSLDNISRREIPRCELDGELVLFDPEYGKYFGLNPVSSAIWDHLAAPTSASEICRRLQEEFEVSEESCQEETAQFLGLLDSENLLVHHD